MNAGILLALASAVLFGASTPFVKQFFTDVGPNAGAALLNLGAGLGLGVVLLTKRIRGTSISPLPNSQRWKFAAAIAVGGVAAPALLVAGTQASTGSTASMLLNLEGAFTPLMAWAVFRENANRRVIVGVTLIVAGGIVLANGTQSAVTLSWGAGLVTLACLCWAADNNLTQAASSADPVLLATIKGLVAAAANGSIALITHQSWPTANHTAAGLAIGFFSYGISLVLFISALSRLGTARTSAYFGIAPFIGAAIALPMFHETIGAQLVVAATLMGGGIWLHVSERHAHQHEHEPIEHEHEHVHDEHHQHVHESGVFGDATKPHTHRHRHERLVHSHPHTPDLHHRHSH